MVVKYSGTLTADRATKKWVISDLAPHAAIRLKSLFPKIPKSAVAPFTIDLTDENSADLNWFLLRYPLRINASDKKLLKKNDLKYRNHINGLERLLRPTYKPKPVVLKEPFKARGYQLVAKDFILKQKRILIADEFGLGKTLSSILAMTAGVTLPALVVCQTHLQEQWAGEIQKFTNLTIHKIKGTRPYSLPAVDVYIIKYSCLSGWVDVFTTGIVKYMIADECQELRNEGSGKYFAAYNISGSVEYCAFLSATPLYNYGNEIFNVLHCMKQGCLGNYDDFSREWTGYSQVVRDPVALGSYLRDNFLILRRTRAEVGYELPRINKIVYTVDYDEEAVKKEKDLLYQLAYRVMHGTFIERGSSSRELDLRLRQITGVSKADSVAAFVTMLALSGEKILLGGWHREVYERWKDYFDRHNVSYTMYTGSESPKQKLESKERFVNGGAQVFIMSLRSGAGLDGLQGCCKFVVNGELDWSPKVHDQFIARVDRPGQADQVTAIYLTSEYGSDPPMIDILGIKSEQAHGIVDPLLSVPEQYNDESRMVTIAKRILDTQKPVKQTA